MLLTTVASFVSFAYLAPSPGLEPWTYGLTETVSSSHACLMRFASHEMLLCIKLCQWMFAVLFVEPSAQNAWLALDGNMSLQCQYQAIGESHLNLKAMTPLTLTWRTVTDEVFTKPSTHAYPLWSGSA